MLFKVGRLYVPVSSMLAVQDTGGERGMDALVHLRSPLMSAGGAPPQWRVPVTGHDARVLLHHLSEVCERLPPYEPAPQAPRPRLAPLILGDGVGQGEGCVLDQRALDESA